MMEHLNAKRIVGLLVAAVILVGMLTVWFGGFGYNEDHEFQILQHVSGAVEVIDEPGYYWKAFGKEKTWPRAMQFEYKDIRVTFNDGGTADVTGMVRIQLPTSEKVRRELNQQFTANPLNLEKSVEAHLTNVLKATAPTMSASEHQTSRKGEFQGLVFKQVGLGIYKMRRIEQVVKDFNVTPTPPVAPNADGTVPPIAVAVPTETRTIFVNEIVTDDEGVAVIDQESPLKGYEIQVLQLSIGDVNYDPKTRELFDAKKESFLKAEQSKAERMQEYEQTLMVIQKGQREKAEAEASANVEKATAVIQAEQKAEVALQTKIEAETKAEELLSVAALTKQTAETKAEQELAVATLAAQSAEQAAKGITTLAAAEEERIIKAGAMTEEKEKTLEILKERDIGVAEALSKVKVPAIVMSGNAQGVGGEQASSKDQLMQLYLFKQLGILNAKDLEARVDAAIADDVTAEPAGK